MSTEQRDDGGPAFPAEHYNLHPNGVEQIGNHTYRFPGMTLRDYFAAKAMQAAIANKSELGLKDDAEMARKCYQTADTMLRARKS